MSDEELITAYRNAVQEVRYYYATDDIKMWRSEEAQRKAADTKMNEYKNELVKRGLPVPNVP